MGTICQWAEANNLPLFVDGVINSRVMNILRQPRTQSQHSSFNVLEVILKHKYNYLQDFYPLNLLKTDRIFSDMKTTAFDLKIYFSPHGVTLRICGLYITYGSREWKTNFAFRQLFVWRLVESYDLRNLLVEITDIEGD